MRPKKTFKSVRTFGGEQYGARHTAKTKKNAVRTARELRADGNKVRTVKMTNEYIIYGRRK